MKKLSLRCEHVLRRDAQLKETIQAMSAQLHVMEEKLLTLYKLLQKEKRSPLKSSNTLPTASKT